MIRTPISVDRLSHLGGLYVRSAYLKLEVTCDLMTSQPDSGVVLIVEDPWICKFLGSVLARAGHRTVEADAQHGVDLVRSGEVNVKALITNTPAAFRAVAEKVPLVYTTSCPDPEATQGFRQCRVLQKPFHAGQLLEALHQVNDGLLSVV